MSTDSASSSRSSSSDSTHDHRRRSSSRYEEFRRASRRLDEQADRQTWSEFLRDADDETTSRNESSGDRKRRLTGPREDGRTNHGVGNSSNPGHSSGNQATARLPPTPPRQAFGVGRDPLTSQPLFYDLTSSSPPQVPPRPNRPNRPDSDSRRSESAAVSSDYIVPRWQSDSEVTHCPICKSQFTFWFRKHHCRKCGRVVCAGCSPHRITIPRQFIVHPPENQRASIFQNEPIDLTQDDTENSAEENSMPPQRANPALGGGEEVRLCRPCVPDPQPAPPGSSRFMPNPSSTLPNLDRVQHYSNGVIRDANRNSVPGSLQFRTMAEHFEGRPWSRDWQNDRDVFVSADGHRRSTSLMHDSFGSPSAQSRQEEGQRQRDLRRQRGRGMIFQPEGSNFNAIRTGTEEIPEEGLPRYGAFDYTVVPRYTRPRLPPGYSPSNNSLPAPPEYSSNSGSTSTYPNTYRNSLPNLESMPPNMGRFSTFASGRPPLNDPSRSSPGGRPRVRSMLDPTTSSASSSAPRARITESDICPICFRIFPPIGPTSTEASREQHIAECISSREAASSLTSHSRSMSMSSRPNPAEGTSRHRVSISSQQNPEMLAQSFAPEVAPQMLPFKANEKDCMGQDGNPQECSICMVEYDVGDSLARLECLCCFHEECIRSWFERKKECPVHKVA